MGTGDEVRGVARLGCRDELRLQLFRDRLNIDGDAVRLTERVGGLLNGRCLNIVGPDQQVSLATRAAGGRSRAIGRRRRITVTSPPPHALTISSNAAVSEIVAPLPSCLRRIKSLLVGRSIAPR